MILTSALAQQVVDTIMPIAQHNINIMDSQGIIVGSGQPERLHTFHQGAQDAIRHGKTIEIYQDELEQYSGSYPGLNMPIILHEQIIGVVGVTGHPHEVRNIARIVKLVTELIVEQEILLEEARSQYQLKENFVAMLLTESNTANHQKLSKTAKLLKYDLTLPRLVLIVDVQPLLDSAFEAYGVSDLVASRARDNALQTVNKPPYLTEQDLAVYLEDRLVLLKHFPAQAAETAFRNWGAAIAAALYALNDKPLPLGLGSLATSYTTLVSSYQEALFALRSQSTAAPLATIYDFVTLSAYLVASINHNANCQPIEAIKTKLHTGLVRKYDMKNTVVSLLNNNLTITSTAKDLYIHRNTLLFRLNKLKEVTGLDPCRDINHAFLCKIIFTS